MRIFWLLLLMFSRFSVAAQETASALPDSLSAQNATPIAVVDTGLTVAGFRFFLPDSADLHSIYGRYAGGKLRQNKWFAVTAPVKSVPEQLRVVQNMDWKFYLFCGIIFFLALLRQSFSKYFSDLFRLFFNTSVRQKQLKDQLSQSTLPSLLLTVFFFITGGLFLYFVMDHLGLSGRFQVYASLIFWVVVVAGLYLGKYLVVELLGWAFGMPEASENYLFVIFNVNKITGLFLLPFVILLAYANVSEKEVILTVAVAGLFLLATARLARGYLAVNYLLKINIFHYLIFVSAFEVMPVMLIYKLLVQFIS